MENYQLEQDINLCCIKATSFPDGIMAAHQAITELTSQGEHPNYYGVSYWYDGKILYMAGADRKPDGETTPGCEPYTLKKGNYISIYIANFRENPTLIEQAFKQLLEFPGIDENGCCAECYFPEGAAVADATDVRCMVRLAD